VAGERIAGRWPPTILPDWLTGPSGTEATMARNAQVVKSPSWVRTRLAPGPRQVRRMSENRRRHSQTLEGKKSCSDDNSSGNPRWAGRANPPCQSEGRVSKPEGSSPASGARRTWNRQAVSAGNRWVLRWRRGVGLAKVLIRRLEWSARRSAQSVGLACLSPLQHHCRTLVETVRPPRSRWCRVGRSR
jgi:hypothetical protein